MSAEGVFHIEAGHIAMMERSFGVAARWRANALAPLTFTQAAVHEEEETHLRPTPGRPWKGSGREATSVDVTAGDGEGWLHAEQHFVYHRHPHAGETLIWTRRPGKTWTKVGASSTLTFAEEVTTFFDAEGVEVIESIIVRVKREAAA